MTQKTTTAGYIHKLGVSIVSVIVLGVLAFIGNTTVSLADRVSRIEEREKSTKEILIEIKKDVKVLIRRKR